MKKNESDPGSLSNRIDPLDYLKCIFIILMVIFHLVYIGDKYPYAKQIVYTFHMPAFLILSGYLTNIHKKGRLFFQSMVWIFIPYAIMETGYVAMSAILPIREKVDVISIPFILNKVFISPMGPYWYLHTLIICCTTSYVIHKITFRINKLSSFVTLGTCFWILSDWFHVLSMANAIYFMIGFIIHQCKLNFLSIFQPSVWGVFPLIVLCCYPTNLNRFTLAGIVITYLVISLSLWIYRYLPGKIQSITHFIGKNTLTILLFSPIFTLISKIFVPIFSFDPSGLSFMCVAVTFVITGSLSIAWCLDKMRLSYWFCRKGNLLNLTSLDSLNK